MWVLRIWIVPVLGWQVLYLLSHLPSPERACDYIRKGSYWHKEVSQGKSPLCVYPASVSCCPFTCLPKGSKTVKTKAFIFIQIFPCSWMPCLDRCQFHLRMWYGPGSSTSSYPLVSSMSCASSLGLINSFVSMSHIHFTAHCSHGVACAQGQYFHLTVCTDMLCILWRCCHLSSLRVVICILSSN